MIPIKNGQAVQTSDVMQYTIRFELITGKVLEYNIDSNEHTFLFDVMEHLSKMKDRNERDKEFIHLKITRQRLVILCANELLRVTIRWNIRQLESYLGGYIDNFGIAPSKEELHLIAKEYGEIAKDDGIEEILPHLIVYHKDSSTEIPNLFVFPDVDEGGISDLESELFGDAPMRQFIRVLDADGEYNYISTRQIVCLETSMHVFNLNR